MEGFNAPLILGQKWGWGLKKRQKKAKKRTKSEKTNKKRKNEQKAKK